MEGTRAVTPMIFDTRPGSFSGLWTLEAGRSSSWTNDPAARADEITALHTAAAYGSNARLARLNNNANKSFSSGRFTWVDQ